MNTFTIHYQNNDLAITQEARDRFTVQFPDKTVQLVLKQDNEGANHWFEAGTDHETPTSSAIGVIIETYLIKVGS